MIKFFGLIPRKPDISPLEFHDHYRHPHGTLGYKNRGYVGYVQSHHITTSVAPCPTSPFEAIAEVWFDNITTAPTTVKLIQFLPESDPLDEALHISLAGRLRALRATRCTPVAQVYATDSPAFGSVREFWWPTESMLIDAVRNDPDAWSQLLHVPSGSESLIARAERFI